MMYYNILQIPMLASQALNPKPYCGNFNRKPYLYPQILQKIVGSDSLIGGKTQKQCVGLGSQGNRYYGPKP